MTNLTNKSLEFLSNEELINILQSVLSEIDVAENVKAHRSTTYLAVSAIEGLFGELLKLLMLEPSTVPSWPKDRNGKYLKPESLNNMIEIFDAANALPDDFKLDFYHTLRQYRNYMHPKTELHDLKPIKQSV